MSVSVGYLAFACLVRERRVVWDCFFLPPVRKDVWFTHFSGGYARLLELVPMSEDRCWFPMQRGGKLVRERLLDTCRPMRVSGCEPTILKAE